MTKDEIEKAAEEYAEKVYGGDSVPISWHQEDGFALLAKARQQIKEAVLFGAEHAQPRWISVEESKPPFDTTIVAAFDRSGIDIGQLDCPTGDDWHWSGREYGYIDKAHRLITHWLLIPPPPEGEK